MNIRGAITYSSGGAPRRTVSEFDVRVREVCEDCNSGWLHRLERAFRALMRLPINCLGPITLEEDDQRTVATWGVKTWLLLEKSVTYLRQQPALDLAPHAYHWVREHAEPPPGFQVWVGAVDAVPARLISYVANEWVGQDNPPAGIAAIVSIGCLLFFIYTPLQFADLPKPEHAFRLGLGPDMSTRLVPIWPIEARQRVWPPGVRFSAEELEKRWSGGGRMAAPVRPGP